MSALWANYLFLLDAHPLRTKAVSAALIAAAGDVCAQLIEHHRAAARRKDAINLDGGDGRNGVWGKWKDGFAGFEWNRARTLRLGFYGFAIGGPITHLWYLALEHTYGPSRALSTSLAKMATDQILAAPVFTATFFAVNGILEARKLEEVRERVRRDLWSTLKANWLVWPLALTLNFLFIPQALRVLYVNALGLVWGSYLSLVQNKPSTSSTEQGIKLAAIPSGQMNKVRPAEKIKEGDRIVDKSERTERGVEL